MNTFKETSQQNLPVAVIGAGPVGLAAVAHLVQRGIDAILLESGPNVADSFRKFAHVRLFSPWRYNLDKVAVNLLQRSGWKEPELDSLPTAGDMVRQYLEPLAATPEIAGLLHLQARVIAISREGFDKVKTKGREYRPFVLRVQVASGELQQIRARAVIDSSGTWSTPNPLGADGLPAHGEPENQDRIFYGIPDILKTMRPRYDGRRTLVVGSGHSAANSLLALASLAKQSSAGAQIIWAVRGTDLRRVFGGGDSDALPARGQLGTALRQLHQNGGLQLVTGFSLEKIERSGETLTVTGRTASGERQILDGIHEIICATGQRPDFSSARELRLKLDPWLESSEALGPLIDPNLHSCGTVRPHGHRELSHPEPGFYVAGVKSYGRAPTFLMATGYEQVRSIAAALAGDFTSADEVHLDLPETGVCSVTLQESAGSASCCGTATLPQLRPLSKESSCCAANPAQLSASLIAEPAGACCG